MSEVRMEGHGTWQQSDGMFRVPDNVTVVFFCTHDQQVWGNLPRHSARRETVAAGQMCPNYRLWPLYGGNTLNCNHAVRFPVQPMDGESIDVVIGVHAVGIELAYLIHCLVNDQPGAPILVLWYACREVVDASKDMFIQGTAPVSVGLFKGIKDEQDAWPEYRNCTKVPMLLPGEAIGQLREYTAWSHTRIQNGVVPNIAP